VQTDGALVLEFAHADYYAFNPRPIRAGNFGQSYSGESSTSFRPAHVGNTISVPSLYSETLEQDNPGSRSVGVLQDVAVPLRMANQNHTQPVVHTGIVLDVVIPSRVIPHPQTQPVIPAEIVHTVDIPLRVTHVIPVLPRVPPVAEHEVYADISAEDFACNNQAPV
jgi:hypothetical protein